MINYEVRNAKGVTVRTFGTAKMALDWAKANACVLTDTADGLQAYAVETIVRERLPFDGKYEVSDLGRVRSLDRVETYTQRFGARIFPVARRHRGAILQPGVCESGHLLVMLGRGNPRQVHALVLTTFVGPKPPGQEGCHGDGDPANNTLDNLRWDTRAGNVADTVMHGTQAIGEKHGGVVLRAADIPVIRRLLKTQTMPAIAADYGVSRGCILAIKRGVTWKHIPLEDP